MRQQGPITVPSQADTLWCQVEGGLRGSTISPTKIFKLGRRPHGYHSPVKKRDDATGEYKKSTKGHAEPNIVICPFA